MWFTSLLSACCLKDQTLNLSGPVQHHVPSVPLLGLLTFLSQELSYHSKWPELRAWGYTFHLFLYVVSCAYVPTGTCGHGAWLVTIFPVLFLQQQPFLPRVCFPACTRDPQAKPPLLSQCLVVCVQSKVETHENGWLWHPRTGRLTLAGLQLLTWTLVRDLGHGGVGLQDHGRSWWCWGSCVLRKPTLVCRRGKGPRMREHQL